jgi:hypothetical protein
MKKQKNKPEGESLNSENHYNIKKRKSLYDIKNSEEKDNMTMKIKGLEKDVEGEVYGIKFSVYEPSGKGYDTEKDIVDLIIKEDEVEYTGTLVPLKALQEIFNKNEITGENGEGSYFCMPQMVLIKNTKKETIKKTLGDLSRRKILHNYFT